MMKMRKIVLLSVLFVSSGTLLTMEKPQGPMNAEWFYSQQNPFKIANALHQDRKWKDAEDEYNQKLSENVGNEYDQEMAKLNLAACMMAQRKSTEHWSSFDSLIGINKEKQLSSDVLQDKKNKKSVLIRTDLVGIGDIAHFLETAHQLKQRTDWDVTVSIRPFLKGTFSNVVKAYGCHLISEKDEQPQTDYTTHIIGLLGHLTMDPAATKPGKILLEAPERAMKVVKEQVDSVEKDKTLAVIFAGEDRPATLIGGKQLPRNQKDHGRQINPTAFQSLLKKHPKLVVMDCGTPSSRVAVDGAQHMVIAKEEQAFDTYVALAALMKVKANKEIIVFAADQGPANLFARALDPEGQKCMAFIIPNPSEYDVRMEGDGAEYLQMISDCLVVKSESSEVNDQVAALEKALQKIIID